MHDAQQYYFDTIWVFQLCFAWLSTIYKYEEIGVFPLQ